MASSHKCKFIGESKKKSVSNPLVKKDHNMDGNLFISPSADIQYLFTNISSYNKNYEGQLFPSVEKRRTKPPYIVNQVNRFPDEIVRYIYLLTLLSNERRWKKNHKRLMWKSHGLISFEKNHVILEDGSPILMEHNEKWVLEKDDGKIYKSFTKRLICDNARYINHKSVHFVNIDDDIAEMHDIEHRKYKDNGQYWFHENCRCRDCDIVKVSRLCSKCKSVGSKELHSALRSRYNLLRVAWNTDRWFTFEYPFELGLADLD